MTHTFAEVSVDSTTEADIIPAEPTHSISKRRIKPLRPIRPKRAVNKYLLVNQDNHNYTNVMSNCDEYLEIIEQKDQEIEVLKKEIDRLRGAEQAELRKKLKEEHDLEMKKFDERKSGIGMQNSISISNEPEK